MAIPAAPSPATASLVPEDESFGGTSDGGGRVARSSPTRRVPGRSALCTSRPARTVAKLGRDLPPVDQRGGMAVFSARGTDISSSSATAAVDRERGAAVMPPRRDGRAGRDHSPSPRCGRLGRAGRYRRDDSLSNREILALRKPARRRSSVPHHRRNRRRSRSGRDHRLAYTLARPWSARLGRGYPGDHVRDWQGASRWLWPYLTRRLLLYVVLMSGCLPPSPSAPPPSFQSSPRRGRGSADSPAPRR